VDFALEIGDAATTISVKEEVPLVESRNGFARAGDQCAQRAGAADSRPERF
jgi:hypothetical protein